MLVTLFGITIDVRLLAPKKAYDPMLISRAPSSNVIFCKPEYWKAYDPMLVTLFGITIDVRLLAPLKAESPMLVTLFGITIDVRLLAKVKAEFPMLVASVMITSVKLFGK